MTLPVTTSDSECGNPSLLIESIQTYLSYHLGVYKSLSSKIVYLDAANHLPDHICEVLVSLLREDIETHQYLWLHSVVELAKIALAVTEAHLRLSHLPDSRISNASNVLKARIHDVFGAINKFLRSWNMDILRAGNAPIADQESILYLDLVQLACNALVSGQDLLDGVANVPVIADSLIKYVQMVADDKDAYKAMAASMFPALVCVAKAAFFSGQPEAVIPLAFEGSLVSESTATDVLSNLKPNYQHVMDFYRYYGYCFVTLAAMGESINQIFTDTADVFLRVLLKLPNLQTSNYLTNLGPSAPPPHLVVSRQYFSDTDREELSFFFLLNTQLHYTTLDQYMRSDRDIKNELHYFTTQFNGRVSKDLTLLASPFQSYSNSVISVPSLEHRILAQPAVANSKTLSTIIFDGTYKEKVNLVLQFFKRSGSFVPQSPDIIKRLGSLVTFVQLFNLSGTPRGGGLATKIRNGDILHFVDNIDKNKFPGKALFVQAIDKTVRLFELLSVLHLSDTVGLSSNPDALIARLFNTGHTFHDVALVKDLTSIQSHGKCTRMYGKSVLDDDQIAAQLSILLRTQQIEACIQKLT